MTQTRFPILNARDANGACYGEPNIIGSRARVSKRIAKRLFEAGYTVRMVPAKMMPITSAESPMGLAMNVGRGTTYSPDHNTFDALCNEFGGYNCCYETGYYLAFYVYIMNHTESPAYSGRYIGII